MQSINPINISEKKKGLETLEANLLKLSTQLQNEDEKIVARKSLDLITLVKHNMHNPLAIQSSLQAYIKSLAPIMSKQCDKATTVQLDNSLDTITQKWIAQYKINLEHNRILIMGPHGPRKQSIEMQYYLDLYKDRCGIPNAEDDKCYYVESLEKFIPLTDIHQDLIHNFLAKEEWNKVYGKSRENNCKMMSSDILGSYAPGILSKLFNKKLDQCPMKLIKNMLFTGPSLIKR